MQKIKLSIINNLIEKRATSKEIDFLVYISRFQSETGEVKGVYYKDVCSELGMAYQTFYDVKESLTKKGFIKVRRESEIDYDITILNNDFSDKNFKCGYISLRHEIFKTKDFYEKFYKMKANEKIFLFEILSNNYSHIWKKKCSEFYEKYMTFFGVEKRVLRSYIRTMRRFFSIRHENYCYIFYPIIKNKDSKKMKPDKLQTNEFMIRAACRRNRIKNFKNEEITDTTKLIKQYKDIYIDRGIDALVMVIDAIAESLYWINQYKGIRKKWERSLRPKLVHKIIKIKLDI